VVASFSTTGGISSIPTKMCTGRRGRRKRIVTPSIRSRTISTTPFVAVSRSFLTVPSST